MRPSDERRAGSGYTLRTLASHFWRMVLTSGTRLLRLVSVLGVAFGLLGVLFALVLGVIRLTGSVPVAGWTSVMVVVLVGTGAVLFSLGIVAEYLGVAVNMAMGKPSKVETKIRSRAAKPARTTSWSPSRQSCSMFQKNTPRNPFSRAQASMVARLHSGRSICSPTWTLPSGSTLSTRCVPTR